LTLEPTDGRQAFKDMLETDTDKMRGGGGEDGEEEGGSDGGGSD